MTRNRPYIALNPESVPTHWLSLALQLEPCCGAVADRGHRAIPSCVVPGPMLLLVLVVIVAQRANA